MKAIEIYGDDWERPVGTREALLRVSCCDCLRCLQTDFTQWIVDEVAARGAGARDVVLRLLAINFAAIFTTSNVSFRSA